MLALLAGTVEGAVARTISWSGYSWDVRPSGFGGPGPNHWSDSAANVSIDGSDLVLAIVRDSSGNWTSAEVDNTRHLGYGTYRWVVRTDLSALDSHEVLGMFTYGGSSPSNNEIDIEPSHWGNLSWPTGSATVWQDAAAGRNQVRTFDYTARPPYVNQFTWEPGRITYHVMDAAGATLLDWTVTSGVPAPSSEVPMINYWRFAGAPPAGVRRMRIASFTWLPPGHPDAALRRGSAVTNALAWAERPRRAHVRMQMRPQRFPVAGARRGTTIRWRATGKARVRLAVKRRVRGRGYVEVGRLARSVAEGAGRIRFTGTVGGRRLRRGIYRLVPTAPDEHVRFAPKHLRFTVLRR
jgi:hypothetical protein